MKPALLFTGEVFEQDPEHKRIKNLLIGKWTIVVFDQDPEHKRIKNLIGEWTIVVFEQDPEHKRIKNLLIGEFNHCGVWTRPWTQEDQEPPHWWV